MSLLRHSIQVPACCPPVECGLVAVQGPGWPVPSATGGSHAQQETTSNDKFTQTGPERSRSPASNASPQEARPATKKQQLIDLLSGAKPVAAEKVSKTLDWQPHTVRAAITGLRKAGFVVDTTKGFRWRWDLLPHCQSSAINGGDGLMAGMVSSKQQRVAQELARLAALDRAGCLDLWKTWFDCEAPRYLSAVFMRKALAHEAQCRLLGGLPAADVRSLRSIASGKRSAVRVAPALSAGTHLVREWNGRTYQVEVTKSGYVMDGKTYRSLTAIARRITGANWSGPRFFGLVDRSDRQQDGDKPRSAVGSGR